MPPKVVELRNMGRSTGAARRTYYEEGNSSWQKGGTGSNILGDGKVHTAVEVV